MGDHWHHCSEQVQRYETEHEKFCDWLNDKKREISAFGPVPATPDKAEEELAKLQVLHGIEHAHNTHTHARTHTHTHTHTPHTPRCTSYFG